MRRNTYLEFLRYCLDETLPLPESSCKIDWMKMMDWAEEQSIVGIIYGGIQKAGKALNIPFDDLMEWIGYAQDIENRNKLVNRRCVEIVSTFQKDGYETCILKGQGNAMMYPNPLLRTPGDIDVWVRSEVRGKKLEVRSIVRYVKERNPEGKACYHHVEYGEFNGVDVEVHYRPSYMSNPLHNRRLQRFFVTQISQIVELPEGVGTICVPTQEFNVVFQLSHVYRHLLREGVGLRQVMDYYFLLKLGNNNQLRVEKEELRDSLRSLGLEKIAGAMMWVMHEVLGLEEKYLIAPMDEKRGKVLLAEIMKGGNFGFYDAENQRADSRLKKNIQRLKRDARLLRYFPSECLWEPIFRLWHFGWRVVH